MSESLLQRLYRRRDRLFLSIYTFNLLPTRYMHLDWIKDLSPDVTEQLLASVVGKPRSERRISRFILAKRNIDEEHFHCFEDPSQRFALLDSGLLNELLFYAGVAVSHRTIAHQVEREKVIALRRALGENGYLFALKKAPFLLGKADLPGFAVEETGDLSTFFVRRGLQCLKTAFLETPSSIAQRMLLKLPKELGSYWDNECDALFEGDSKRAQLLLRKILLREVSPEWTPYF